MNADVRGRPRAAVVASSFERGFGAFLSEIGAAIEDGTSDHVKAFAVKTLVDKDGVVGNVRTFSHHLWVINRVYWDLGLPSPVDNDAKYFVNHTLRRASRKQPGFVEPSPKAIVTRVIASFDERVLVEHRAKCIVGLIWHLGCPVGLIQRLRRRDVETVEEGVRVTWTPKRRSIPAKAITTLIPFAEGRLCVAKSIVRWIERAALEPDDPLVVSIHAGRIERRFVTWDRIVSGAFALGLRRVGYNDEECQKWTPASIRMGHLVTALELGVSPYKITFRMGYDRVENFRTRTRRLPIWHPSVQRNTRGTR